MIEVVPLTDDLCLELAANMRPEDQREMTGMTGDDTWSGCVSELRSILRTSRGLALAAIMDGRLVAAWGVSVKTVIGTTGHPWMLATHEFEDKRFRRVFARRFRHEFLRTIPPDVRSMWNMVDASNAVAIRFLKALNFQFEPDPVEHNDMVWLRFYMEAS